MDAQSPETTVTDPTAEPAQPADPRRVLLCSFCVPWPQRPQQGLHHVLLARAMAKQGVTTRLFGPSPDVSERMAKLWKRARRHYERPDSYQIAGVAIDAPKVPFAFPPSVRHGLAPVAPERLMQAAATRLQAALDRSIEAFRPQVLLGHGVFPWGQCLREAAARHGIRHAFIEHSAKDVLRLARGSRIAQAYANHAHDAAVVFTSGPHMADHLQAELRLPNARWLPNGAVMLDSAKLGQAAAAEEGPVILAAASYYRRKGLEELVQAFDRVAGRHERAQLRIITDAPLSLGYRRWRASHFDRIHLEPPLPQGALLDAMARADVFALPSWSEAFGMVYVEALGAGTPVIMTNDCGLSQVLPLHPNVREGDVVGWSVPPKNVVALAGALEDALVHADRLHAMGNAGRRLVAERFRWRDAARITIDGLFPPAQTATSPAPAEASSGTA